ncbi:hypothetical protein Dimus_009562 [Dionaea muscipula]
MGCMSSKPSVIDDGVQLPWERESSREFTQYDRGVVSQTAVSREDSQVSNRSEGIRSSLIDRKWNGSMRRLPEDSLQKFLVKPDDYPGPGKGTVPKTREAEQVAAGWPSWLVEVAGEAIKGWIPRQADDFQKLDKIGQGTYSSVYKARDLLYDKIVALKRVRFDNLDPESVKFMAREIAILRKLDHPNIIKLEGLIISPTTDTLYLIFEYMEHDLRGLASLPGLKFTEPQVKCYMMQLLRGLDHCHSNGVLHRDVKGANLLIDNHGILKIADFGLANFYDLNQPLTSRVVTLWYRPPELLLGAKHYGPAADLWSAGCILAELYTGKPTLPGRTEIEQLDRIFKLCGSPSEDFWLKMKLPHSEPFRKQSHRRRIAEKLKDIPPSALGLIDTLLSMDPASRGTAASAMKSEFFFTEPLACDPASLPKYPPTKEIDARMREERDMRHESKESEGKLLPDLGRQRTKIPAVGVTTKPAAEFVMPTQKWKIRGNSKGQNERLYSHPDLPNDIERIDDASEDFSGPVQRMGVYSGPLTMGTRWHNTGNRLINPNPPLVHNGAHMGKGNLSSAAPAGAGPSSAYGYHGHSDHIPAEKLSGRFHASVGDSEHPKYEEWLHHTHSIVGKRKAAHAQCGGEPRDEYLHMSGPLLVPSSNVDQMLRQHDRQLQEAARRARFDKSWRCKVQAQERSSNANKQLLVSSYRV